MGAPLIQTAPFADVPLLAAYLREDIAEDDLLAVTALTGATAMIQSYCNQTLSFVADDVVKLDGTGTEVILLPEFPVVGVAEVILNWDLDDPQILVPPGNTSETEWDWSTSGLLTRRLGAVANSNARLPVWPARRKSIQVTYTHGYSIDDSTPLEYTATVDGTSPNTHIDVLGFLADTDTLTNAVLLPAAQNLTATEDGDGIKVAENTATFEIQVTWTRPTYSIPSDIKLVCVAAAARAYAQDGANSETTGSYTVQYAGQPAVLTEGEKRVLDRYRARRK